VTTGGFTFAVLAYIVVLSTLTFFPSISFRSKANGRERPQSRRAVLSAR
jgi:glycopeptide antibiotics resistance protein